MTGRKIFVTRAIPESGLNLLRAEEGFDVTVFPKDRVISRKELLAGARGADAILSLLTEKIDGEVIDTAGPQLKVVANMAVGYDNIDLTACAAKNVVVANTPGVLTDAVAEHTFALMTAICRRIPESDRFTRAGKYKAWEPMLMLGMELKGKTLGIIGLGRIGAGVAERASRGMGMKVMYNDVRKSEEFEKAFGAEYAALDDLLAKADVITIHVPLLPATRHLIDGRRLSLMKKTAYLINTSRGPIIDEQALVEALKKGTIAGAALDVFENEPKLAPGLAKLENVVLTPHTASATIEARSAMSSLAAQAIIDVLRGRTPKNVVQPPKP
jgi:D-3-phosphoglycerate dehydrogenase